MVEERSKPFLNQTIEKWKKEKSRRAEEMKHSARKLTEAENDALAIAELVEHPGWRIVSGYFETISEVLWREIKNSSDDTERCRMIGRKEMAEDIVDFLKVVERKMDKRRTNSQVS